MVNRLVGFIILPCCILALFLSLAGVQHIGYGDDYYVFMNNVTQSFNNWKIAIPNIPKINKINTGDYDKSGLILVVLIKIANFFVGFVNALIATINITITILNIAIQLVQFCFTIIYQCKDFIARMVSVSYV